MFMILEDLQRKDELEPPVQAESLMASPGLYHLPKPKFMEVKSLTRAPISLRIITILDSRKLHSCMVYTKHNLWCEPVNTELVLL